MKKLAALLLIAACHRTPKPVSLAPLPRGAYAHYLAGKMAMFGEDAEGAVREFRAAALAAPDQPMIAVELARASAHAKRAPSARGLDLLPAREVLAAARKKWPDHGQVWLASGEVLEAAAEHTPALRKEALGAYRRAIELEPTDERAYVGLARTQIAAGDGAGGEKTLRALVKKVPSSIDGHYRLAQRLEERGDRAAAAGELRAVLEYEPDHLDARMDLARTLRRMGKLADAVAQTRSAFDRAGQPMDIAEELYWLLCEADDLQGAIDLLTLLDDDRSDADALATVATLNRGLGRVAEARAVAERIKTLDADESVIALAETDIAIFEHARAIKALEAIAESSPRFLESRRVLASAHVAAKQPAKALELLAPLRAAHPEDLELAYAEANAKAAAGDKDGARAAVKGLKGEPIVLAFMQARIAERVGDPAAAITLLETALKKNPNHIGALNLAGYLLARSKQRLGDAERYLARARDLQPGDPAILDSWGWLRLKQGKTGEAIKILERAVRFAPHEPEILVHLATAYERRADKIEPLLRRAELLNPSSEVASQIAAIRHLLQVQ